MTRLYLKKGMSRILEIVGVDSEKMLTTLITGFEPLGIEMVEGDKGLVEFGSDNEAADCLLFLQQNGISVSLRVKNPKVLLVHVLNLLYPVTVEMLHQIFSRAGIVEKIVTFQKDSNIFQAFVQFMTPEHAHKALTSLDNETIYTGCNLLRLQFSTAFPQGLNVKFNNSKTRDYTNPDLPSGPVLSPTAPPQEQSRVLIVYNLHPHFNCERLFNIFSFYGHVEKIKFLHSKPDAALIQFSDPLFAALAMQFLEGQKIFARQIHLDYAKMKEIIAPILPGEFSIPEVTAYRGFSLKERRHGSNQPERVLKSACKPTGLLHIANVSVVVTTEILLERLKMEYENIMGTATLQALQARWISHGDQTKTGLVTFTSNEQATETLVLCHNLLLSDKQIKLSFSKSSPIL